jgi:hypothetical protein
MDTSTIDQAYQQLQTEFQDVANSIQTLAQKLQAAGQAGDTNAREWLLDLKQIALDVKDEQIQVNGLLQAIHTFVDNSHQQLQPRDGGRRRDRPRRGPDQQHLLAPDGSRPLAQLAPFGSYCFQDSPP